SDAGEPIRARSGTSTQSHFSSALKPVPLARKCFWAYSTSGWNAMRLPVGATMKTPPATPAFQSEEIPGVAVVSLRPTDEIFAPTSTPPVAPAANAGAANRTSTHTPNEHARLIMPTLQNVQTNG